MRPDQIKLAARATARGAGAKRKGSRGDSGGPNWVWLVTGIFIGLFLAVLAFVIVTKNSEEIEVNIPAPNNTNKAPADGKSKFEFYNILSEKEVVLPPAEVDKTPPTAEPKLKDGERYILQSGSFREQKEADSRKASLALLGVESVVQAAKNESGETWYRVRVGPYQSLTELKRVRTLLTNKGVETLVIRVRD